MVQLTSGPDHLRALQRLPHCLLGEYFRDRVICWEVNLIPLFSSLQPALASRSRIPRLC